MKKIAITLSAATLLMGALVGCADNQEGATGLGTDQRGFGYHQTDQDTDRGITGQRAGEGPITDMFTQDDRRGARGFGRETRRPTTGLVGEKTRGQNNGLNGTSRRGSNNSTGANIGGAGVGTAGQSAGMRGTGFGGSGHSGGMRGVGGATGQSGSMRAKDRKGFKNDNNGIGGAGIVGDRPGYVDEDGILRGRKTKARDARIGGLGQTGRRNMDDPRATGLDNRGRFQEGKNNTRFGGVNINDRDGLTGQNQVPRTGMKEYTYPTGYDNQTVQKINTRLADVENVRDSRVIVHDNRILVGVDADGDNNQRIEQDIRRTVGGMAGDREIVVVTDRDQFNQVRSVDDRLRGGEAIEEIGATINEMFQDFGRAIQRPFERSR